MGKNVKLLVLEPTEDERKAKKRTEEFARTCREIRRSCEMTGYEGDPVHDLMTAVWGMSVYMAEGGCR